MRLRYCLKVLHPRFPINSMKRVIIVTGCCFVFFNLIVFIVLKEFGLYSFIASELSIATSLVLLLWLIDSKIDSAFKIVLVVAMSFSLVFKYIMSLFFTGNISGSTSFLTLIGILLTEIFGVYLTKYMSRHS